MGREASQAQDLREMLLQNHPWVHSILLMPPWEELVLTPSRVLSIVQPPVEASSPEPKRSRMEVRPALSFSDEDKVATL